MSGFAGGPSPLPLSSRRFGLGGVGVRLQVDPAGLLTVRRFNRLVQQVDLARLTVVVARRVTRRGRGWTRSWPLVEVADDLGGRVQLEPWSWERGGPLLTLIVNAAGARGVDIVGGTELGLPHMDGVTAVAVLGPGAGPSVAPGPLSLGPVAWHHLHSAFQGTWWFMPAVTSVVMFLLLFTAPSVFDRVARWLPMFLFVQLIPVSWWISASRVRLRADGVLTVQTSPWRVEGVRLYGLAAVEAWPHLVVHAPAHGSEEFTRLALNDSAGGALTLDVEAWKTPEVLVPAIAAWAVRSGATADWTTWAYLLRGQYPDPLRTAGSSPDRPQSVWW